MKKLSHLKTDLFRRGKWEAQSVVLSPRQKDKRAPWLSFLPGVLRLLQALAPQVSGAWVRTRFLLRLRCRLDTERNGTHV